jgi:DUF4097 and DUF4098 domain-containing protein YvlB
MPHWRRPSLLGALLWIGLGAVFLLRNFGIGPSFWWLIWHYWPILLILLGLGKVLEYFLHKDSISIHAGEVIGIILLILIGSAISRISDSHFGRIVQNLPIQIGGMSVRPGQWLGETHTFSEEATFPMKDSLPILVENSYGSVSITPGNDREIVVRLKKIIYSSDMKARDIAPQINLEGRPERRGPSAAKLKPEAEPGKKSDIEYFVIRTNRDSLSSKGYMFNTNLEILIPKNSHLQVRNSFGEIRVSDINGNLDLSTTHRVLEVQDCNGQFNISTRFADSRLTNLVGNVNLDSRGKAYIDGIKGDVTVTDEYSPLEIYNVDGKVQVSNNEGSIRIERVTKPVIIDSRGTEVRVENLQDSLKISASHKNVNIADVSSNVSLDSSYATISLKRIRGNLDIRSNSDSVAANDIRGSLKLRAHGSGVRANEVEGPLDIQTTLKNVLVNGFADSCTVTNEYAGISVTARKLGKGDVNLKNHNGDVDLFLPENASFIIDANARNGRIESEFDGLKSRNDEGNGVLKSRLKNGGPRILLETNYGTIRIHPCQGSDENQSVDSNEAEESSAIKPFEGMEADFWPDRLSRFIMHCIWEPESAGVLL